MQSFMTYSQQGVTLPSHLGKERPLNSPRLGPSVVLIRVDHGTQGTVDNFKLCICDCVRLQCYFTVDSPM